jgi:hypothetical protein
MLSNSLNLTNEELNQLVGGIGSEDAGGDVKNTNHVKDCSCSYKDCSAIENDNLVEGCSCSCVCV